MELLSLNFYLYTISGIWQPPTRTSKAQRLFYGLYTCFTLFLFYFLTLSQFLDLVLVVDNVDDFITNMLMFMTMVGITFKGTTAVLCYDDIFNLTNVLLKEPCKVRDAGEIRIQKKFDNFIRFATTVNYIFNSVLFIQFFGSILVLCASVYYLSVALAVSVEFFGLVFYTICMFVQIFIYCWSGNEVTIKSANFGTTIYEIDWLSLTMNEKRSLMVVMKRSTIPIKFTSSFLVTLTLDSYTNVILVVDNVDDFITNILMFMTMVSVTSKGTTAVFRYDDIFNLTNVLLKDPCKVRDAGEIRIQKKFDSFIRTFGGGPFLGSPPSAPLGVFPPCSSAPAFPIDLRHSTRAALLARVSRLDNFAKKDKADACEGQAKEANMRADKVNEEVSELQKKLTQVEGDLEANKQNLEQANKDLEEKEKALTNAESEVAALNRKVQLIEEDLERSEERLNTATAKLAEASQAADESSRMCKVLENRAQQDEERMDQLTNQLKEARLLAEDADGKSDEVSRKLAFVEDELEVAEDRVKSGEAKIMELEEELKVVGNSLKSLEVSEEKANQRVEEFKRQLKTLTVKLKEAEARAEFAEKTVKKLQKEVDRLEDELGINKDRYKSLADEMDSTFAELAGY
ncbi:hypothetical protein KM043_008810 [Ampulex compressa]|nr:hypothetical protein KM043_008810 [Ampulex compressa]